MKGPNRRGLNDIEASYVAASRAAISSDHVATVSGLSVDLARFSDLSLAQTDVSSVGHTHQWSTIPPLERCSILRLDQDEPRPPG